MFTRGNVYRRRHLHQLYGGQEQGGISTPSGHNMIFLFTSDRGQEHGYQDGWTDEGTFLYTGEGQKGDMQFVRGNKAIRDHMQNGKELHLFKQAGPAHVEYIGQMVYVGHHFKPGPDTQGNIRQLIVFELRLLNE